MLSVRTEYMSHESLASYYVETPDPLLENPPMGQRLIVKWSLPQNVLDVEGLHLEAIIRLKNKKEIEKSFPVCHSRGQFIYTLLNDQYFESGGIQTYKIALKGKDCVVEEWRHQLWVELLHFDTTSCETDSNFDFEDEEEKM